MLEYIIFMKVGLHAGENLDAIVRRKREEQRRSGLIFWGYGGTLCHPLTQAQPFAEEAHGRGFVPKLLMSYTHSAARFQQAAGASLYSVNGCTWEALPSGVQVTGSRYALLCANLQFTDFLLDLSEYEIGVGSYRGRRLSDHIRYRVDKACGILAGQTVLTHEPSAFAQITYIADLVRPYSVFLK